MKMVTLGQNKVSALGFGAMRLPVKNGEIDYEQGFAMIDRAMEAGINYFDTAWFYHGGASEVFLRKALVERYPRDHYFLADKLPYNDCQDSESALNERFLVQKERLGVDYIDYYLLHGLGERGWQHCKNAELDKLLVSLKEKGLIKHICFSFHDTPEALEKILSETPDMWDFVQIQLNYYDWSAIGANKMYEISEKYHVPLVVMEPVRGGTLAHLHKDVQAILKAASPDLSIASWAMRYAGSLPLVKVVLSGMSNLEQLNDNIKTFENFKPLDHDENTVLNNAIIAMKNLPLTGCTYCKYCTSVCPKEISIPDIFRLNDCYIQFDSPNELSRWYLLNMPKEKQATACTECGACLAICPQQLQIPGLLKEVHAKALAL